MGQTGGIGMGQTGGIGMGQSGGIGMGIIGQQQQHAGAAATTSDQQVAQAKRTAVSHRSGQNSDPPIALPDGTDTIQTISWHPAESHVAVGGWDGKVSKPTNAEIDWSSAWTSPLTGSLV